MPLRAMIPYTPSPILFSLGPVVIRYYSLAYISGFILIYIWLRRKYGSERAEDSLTWLVLATIIGGRIGYFIFYSQRTFITDPLEILKIWHGGMSFHGGFIALIITTYLYCRKHKIAFKEFADTLVIPAAIGIGLGRIANFLNGELVGTLTNVPWCMQFPGFEGCRHPSQLYEAAYSFALAGILYWQSRKKHEKGFLFLSFIGLYGLFRFWTTFFREDARVLGISEGQVLSLIMVVVVAWIIGTKYKKSLVKMFS